MAIDREHLILLTLPAFRLSSDRKLCRLANWRARCATWAQVRELVPHDDAANLATFGLELEAYMNRHSKPEHRRHVLTHELAHLLLMLSSTDELDDAPDVPTPDSVFGTIISEIRDVIRMADEAAFPTH